MKREDLKELHYITPIANVASILRDGILSHRRAKRIRHESVAMREIQDRRVEIRVPGGRPLHDYANLYICARNPMLYKRQSQHKELCVLRVNTAVLDLPDVVVADQNASSYYVRFGAVPGALWHVDREMVFADVWVHPEDQKREWRHKSAKCAEVLVPDRVPSKYIVGAYVSCEKGREALLPAAPDLTVDVNGHLFFQ